MDIQRGLDYFVVLIILQEKYFKSGILPEILDIAVISRKVEVEELKGEKCVEILQYSNNATKSKVLKRGKKVRIYMRMY